ncbi:putative membrane protein [Clostridium botulinum]|nr:putative membrane protein [Clostridium botulinum]
MIKLYNSFLNIIILVVISENLFIRINTNDN